MEIAQLIEATHVDPSALPEPTFIIIGAMKCGTSSLFRYVATHPDVSVSRIKETNYFLGREEYTRGWAWYRSLFEDAVAIGEASPNYTKRHKWSGVAERIKQAVPHVRLIYVVRDPIKRLVSHYVHNYATGREHRKFRDAKEDRVYTDTSRYAFQIEPFLEQFSQDQIKVLDADDLLHSTADVMREVFEYIGVDGGFEVPNVNEKFHASSGKMRRSVLDRHIANRKIRRVLRRVVPSRWSAPQPFPWPELEPDDVDLLRDLLSHDIDRFRRLTGKNFSNWSV